MEKLEGNIVKLEIEVPEDEVARALEEAYKRISKNVKINGFRKGRVPRKILELRLGKEAIHQEAVEILVPSSYQKAVAESDLRPIDSPKIDVTQLEEGGPYKFTATVQVMPEVDPGDYKSVKVEKKVPPEIKDEDVDLAIQSLREQRAKFEKIDGDALQEGDYAVVDAVAYVDSTEVDDLTRRHLLVEAGKSGSLIGFEEVLPGMGVGETKTIQVEGSKTGNPKYADKTISYEVTVKEIMQKVLPELNDEFVKEVSGASSVDEFKNEIRSRLEKIASDRVTNEMRSEILKKVTEIAKVDVPDVLANRRIDAMIDEMRQSLEMQGMTLESYLEATSTNLEAIRERFKEAATEEVKVDLVLDAIAKAEGIEATDDEVNDEMQQLARSARRESSELRNILGEEGVSSIRRSIERRKTINRLIELCTV